MSIDSLAAYTRWYQDYVSELSDAQVEAADLISAAFAAGWNAATLAENSPKPCPLCGAEIPHDRHFVCVICRIEAPLELGEPMRASGRYRCTDIDACTARILADLGAGVCRCDHIHQAGATLCYVCDRPIKQEGAMGNANQDQ